MAGGVLWIRDGCGLGMNRSGVAFRDTDGLHITPRQRYYTEFVG